MDNPDLNNHEPSRPRQPVFNLPAIIVVFSAVLLAIHVARVWLLSQDANIELIFILSFIPARFGNELYTSYWPPFGAWSVYWSPFTYSLLHADWAHLVMNTLWLFAFGSPVAKRIGKARFIGLCLVASMAGAGLHYITHMGEMSPVIGASAVVSACMGAAIRFAFPQGGRFGMDTENLPTQSLQQAFSNQQVLAFTAVWFGINFLFGSGIIPIAGEGQLIAWEAHIGGFLTGVLLFDWFDRPVNSPSF